MIKAVIFDIGGVLQIPKALVRLIQDTHLAGVPAHCGHRNKSIHEYLASKLKIVLDQWFDAIDTAYAKSIEGKLTEEQVLKVISQNLKVNKYKLKKWLVKAYKRNVSLNKELLRPLYSNIPTINILTGSFPNFIAADIISLAFVNVVVIRQLKHGRLIV